MRFLSVCVLSLCRVYCAHLSASGGVPVSCKRFSQFHIVLVFCIFHERAHKSKTALKTILRFACILHTWVFTCFAKNHITKGPPGKYTHIVCTHKHIYTIKHLHQNSTGSNKSIFKYIHTQNEVHYVAGLNIIYACGQCSYRAIELQTNWPTGNTEFLFPLILMQ